MRHSDVEPVDRLDGFRSISLRRCRCRTERVKCVGVGGTAAMRKSSSSAPVALKQRRVRFTFIAQQHVAREKAWWLGNRDRVDVFAEELEQALKIVASWRGHAV